MEHCSAYTSVLVSGGLLRTVGAYGIRGGPQGRGAGPIIVEPRREPNGRLSAILDAYLIRCLSLDAIEQKYGLDGPALKSLLTNCGFTEDREELFWINSSKRKMTDVRKLIREKGLPV